MSETLSLEKTKELLIAWREKADESAFESLVFYNIGLVKYIANRYRNKGISFEELVLIGTEGLLNGINGFNYLENPIQAFSTYIGRSIRNSILVELHRLNKHSHVLSLDYIMYEGDDGDKMTLRDVVGTDPDQLVNEIAAKMKSKYIKDALQCLSPRERQVIILRYLKSNCNLTKTDVGKQMGISHTMVGIIEKRALCKLSHTKGLKDLMDD